MKTGHGTRTQDQTGSLAR